jgi:hypothetical protein
MATQFSTATAIPQHAPYQHHAYRKSAQYSPNGSAHNTPMNISPTSPRTTTLPLQRHQGIYQPRTAIGIPAALRKTEKPSSKSPPKPDSGVGSPNSGWQVNGGLPQLPNDGNVTPSSQVGNEDMISIYNDAPLSPTAGPITRNHWQVCCYTIFFSSYAAVSLSHLSFVACWVPLWSALTYMRKVDHLALYWSRLPLYAPPTCRASVSPQRISTCADQCNLRRTPSVHADDGHDDGCQRLCGCKVDISATPLCHSCFPPPTLEASPDAGRVFVPCLGLNLGPCSSKRSRPVVLTNPIRQMGPPRYARHPRARNRSACSSVATTAGSAVASSAGSTRTNRCGSMSWHASIPMASCTVHATVAMALSASGNIFARAAPTARAPRIAQQLSKLRRLLRRSVQRMLAWAALLRASKVPGTGAPSELAFALAGLS